eukprot:g966.t1
MQLDVESSDVDAMKTNKVDAKKKRKETTKVLKNKKWRLHSVSQLETAKEMRNRAKETTSETIKEINYTKKNNKRRRGESITETESSREKRHCSISTKSRIEGLLPPKEQLLLQLKMLEKLPKQSRYAIRKRKMINRAIELLDSESKSAELSNLFSQLNVALS